MTQKFILKSGRNYTIVESLASALRTAKELLRNNDQVLAINCLSNDEFIWTLREDGSLRRTEIRK